MKTINTIEDAIKILREPIPYMEPDEDLLKIAEWLEELKDLRVELEKNSKELEVYKRALELACQDVKKHHPILNCLGVEHWNDFYLNKARAEQ